jgi:hypothetical protein
MCTKFGAGVKRKLQAVANGSVLEPYKLNDKLLNMW